MASRAFQPGQTLTETLGFLRGGRNTSLQADAAFNGGRRSYTIDTGIEGLQVTSPTPRLPTAYQVVIARLKELMAAPLGWDSYAGRPLTASSAAAAFDLIAEGVFAEQPPRIEGSSDGSVELFWETADRYLHVSVSNARAFDVYFEDRVSGEEIDPNGSTSQLVAKQALKRYLGQK